MEERARLLEAMASTESTEPTYTVAATAENAAADAKLIETFIYQNIFCSSVEQ
jgi:hypothetical protein